MKISQVIIILAIGWLTACSPPKKTPSNRPETNLPVYTQGDVAKGKIYYEQECEQCHKLQIGSNEKGPQLLNIYGSKSALLTDYNYTDALKNSQIIWSSEMLDKYIADPKKPSMAQECGLNRLAMNKCAKILLLIYPHYNHHFFYSFFKYDKFFSAVLKFTTTVSANA